MSRRKRVEITLGLSWLFAAACGGAPATGPEEMIQQFDPIKGTSPNSPSKPAAAGSVAAPSIVRASARIEPLVVAAPAATSTSTASAGASAGAAGTSAGSGAAGTSSSAGASAGGQSGTSAGSGGTGTGAGLAAGSGGEAGSSTASAGTGAGGTSAAGSSAPTMTAAAGTDATAASTGTAGMAASAGPAKAGAGGFEAPASIMGSANFASNASGVSMTVMVSGCQSGKEYPIHLHQGSSCESAMTQGGHWDMTRGEGIPNIKCGGRQGATMVMRAKTDASTAWSVGDASATDVVGHTVVIHDADDPTVRIACGVITKN